MALPGSLFGGENYFRIVLCADIETIKELAARIK